MPTRIYKPQRIEIDVGDEPPEIPPRKFAAFSFLYAHFFDQGINGRRARDTANYGLLEFVRPIQILFLNFLRDAGAPFTAIEFMSMCEYRCKIWQIVDLDDQALINLVAATERITVSDPLARTYLVLPHLRLIPQVPLAFRQNIAAALWLKADYYLTFDPSERAYAAQCGLMTDFGERRP